MIIVLSTEQSIHHTISLLYYGHVCVRVVIRIIVFTFCLFETRKSKIRVCSIAHDHINFINIVYRLIYLRGLKKTSLSWNNTYFSMRFNNTVNLH